jgi:hypothetical protein
MLTRATFELVANTIRQTELDTHARELLARALADTFARTNPRFSRERFLTACGVQQS